jgi:hypothetical protein
LKRADNQNISAVHEQDSEIKPLLSKVQKPVPLKPTTEIPRELLSTEPITKPKFESEYTRNIAAEIQQEVEIKLTLTEKWTSRTETYNGGVA